MKISELIEKLEITKYHVGDVVCLIEVNIDDILSLVPVSEISYEERETYGPSISLLQK